MNSSDISKIQIFIVTRNEVEDEFLEISDFINEINRHLERAYSLSIDLMTIEDMEAPDWKQAEYRKKICESEMVFFLIFMKMEDFLIEDFEAAFEKLKNNGKPDIYTYFYQGIDTERDKSVQKFMDRLGNEIGHYWSIYSHIDTIKLKILMCLKLSKLDMVEMAFRNGKFVIDEKDIMPLDNVKMFAENYTIKYLTEKRAKIEKEYIAAKSLYLQNKQDKEICQKYLDLTTERENILKNIEETEKQLFKQSLNMIETVKGEFTERQREAYRLFEDGKSEAANEILDSEEMKNDFKRKMQKRKEEDKKLASIHIREFKTKIEILETMTEYRERFKDITDAYEEITKTAFEYKVEYDSVCDYLYFLYEQGNSEKSLNLGKVLEEIYNNDESVTEENKSDLYNTLGIITNSIAGMQREAEEYYLAAIKIEEDLLAKKNPDRFSSDLIGSYNLAGDYNNVGMFYNDQGKIKDAEGFYLAAIKIREELAKKNPDRFSSDLVNSYNLAGILFADQGRIKEAENFFSAALEICKELVKKNPDRLSSSLANSYNNIGVFYAKQRKTKEAEKLLLAALEIYEELAKKNPDRFSSSLAMIYNTVGMFYKNQGKTKETEEYYLAAIKIGEELVEKNLNRFSSDLANSYNHTGIFYDTQGKTKKAEKFYLAAIKIREELVKKNPDRFSSDLAISYYNYGNFKEETQYLEMALNLAKDNIHNPCCRQIVEYLQDYF